MRSHHLTSFKRLALISTALACATTVQAAGFIRPEVGMMEFGNSKYEAQLSYGVATGVQFGEQGQHELCGEWTHAKIDYADLPPKGVIGGGSTHMIGKLDSLLVGYRYQFGNKNQRFRAFCGPVAGFAKHDSDITAYAVYPNGEWNGSVSTWAPALGAVGGVDFKVNDKVTIQIGLRSLAMNDLGKAQLEQINKESWRSASVGSMTSHFVFMAVNFGL